MFSRFVAEKFPSQCNLPTGLGKTSIIPIWLLALLSRPAVVPRRLVYVVNRRTVVDQATAEAVQIRNRLTSEMRQALQELCAEVTDEPLAISTLRGQFADKAEWRADPARPAIVIGTVDMIGSRLLFGGYGLGFKSKPTHAGLLGHDTLLVHDEAHLEPAFQELLEAVVAEQSRQGDSRAMRVMALTATSRGTRRLANDTPPEPPFQLTEAELNGEVPVVSDRLFAKKGLRFHSVADERSVRDEVVQRALGEANCHRNSGQAILVFVRKVDDVKHVVDALLKKKVPTENIGQLTGTLRGYERDGLVSTPAFQRFLSHSKRDKSITSIEGTVYLVCTSAGEVGVDLSADHLICDLMPFESMAQRFGRVNRFGNGDALIDVVHPKALEEKDQLAPARQLTLALLAQLPTREADGLHDASPLALGKLDQDEREAAFSPLPEILATTDILLDAWALTSIRDGLPGRPPLADWLHGVAGWEPPETHVAWREEVEVLQPLIAVGQMSSRDLEDLLADYPLKPHELLRDNSRRVMDELLNLSSRLSKPDSSKGPDVWVIDPTGNARCLLLSQLVAKDSQKAFVDSIDHCTILLPPSVGAINVNGMLDANAGFDRDRSNAAPYDISDLWQVPRRSSGETESLEAKELRHRVRVWDDEQPPRGMRLVRTIDTNPDPDSGSADDENGAAQRRFWKWYVRPRSADDEGSRSASVEQLLSDHLDSAEAAAHRLVQKLALTEPEATAVVLAAKWHDLGKARAVWQQSIRNFAYPDKSLAKSGNDLPLLNLNHYRHEFGSLLDAQSGDLSSEFEQLTPEVRELVLHLIAAHHGRARPHFPEDEAFDPKYSVSTWRELANDTPQRFGRLQRRYGRWGLAWLESLVRAADVVASQPSAERLS